MLKIHETSRIFNAGGNQSSSSSTTHRRAHNSTIPDECYFTLNFNPEEKMFFQDPEGRNPRTYVDANGETQVAAQPEYTLVSRCSADGTILQSKSIEGKLDDIVERFFTSWWSKVRYAVRVTTDPKTKKKILEQVANGRREANGDAVEYVGDVGDYTMAYEFLRDNKIVMKFKKSQAFLTEDRFARDRDGNAIEDATRTDWVPTITFVKNANGEFVKAHYAVKLTAEEIAKAEAIAKASDELEQAKDALTEAQASGDAKKIEAAEKALTKAQNKVNSLA